MRDAASRSGRVVLFGVFEADLEAGELRRRGKRLRLQDRPFRILEVLLERPGEVVTRQDLRDRLWSADTFVDFEHGLDAAMNKLRDALGDSAASPRFIETIPRRGYRFLVSPYRAGSPPSLAEGRKRVAVLPFRNDSGDPAQEQFCDGLTSEMIIRLGRLGRERLAVIACHSVQRYRNGDRSPERVARELDVDYVLDGTLRRASGRVRIGAQLVEVRDRTILWANSYDGGDADELAIQRQVAVQVAGSLAGELLAAEAGPSTDATQAVTPSRELRLMGRHWLGKRTPEGFLRALDLFRRASALNPECAATHAAIAEALVLGAEYGVFDPSSALPEARESVLRGLEVDPVVSDGHLILGYIRHRRDWDWTGAEDEYLHARHLNRSCADTLHQYAEFLSHVGRHDEAIAAIRHARRLDPYSLVLGAEEAVLLVAAGRAEEALQLTDRLIETEPGFAVPYDGRARAFLALGRPREALEAAGDAFERSGGTPYMLATYGVAAARCGDQEALRRALAGLTDHQRAGYVSSVHFARVHAAQGDADAACERLEEGFVRRDAEMTELCSDPEWTALADAPRYRALVERLAFPKTARV